MPNIRFTRGGKWLHQQCKSYKWGSSDTATESAVTKNTIAREELLSHIKFTEEEKKKLFAIEAENERRGDVVAKICAVNLFINAILFFAGICWALSLVIYALISTAITFLIIFVHAIYSGVTLDNRLKEQIEKIKAERKTNK